MEKESERNIYQLSAVFCLFALIFVGNKYSNLRFAYQKAETEKIEFCKENEKLKSQNLDLEIDNSRYLDYIQKIEE